MDANTEQMRQLAGRLTSIGDDLASFDTAGATGAVDCARPRSAATTAAAEVVDEMHRVLSVHAERLLMIADHATSSASTFDTVDGRFADDLRTLGG